MAWSNCFRRRISRWLVVDATSTGRVNTAREVKSLGEASEKQQPFWRCCEAAATAPRNSGRLLGTTLEPGADPRHCCQSSRQRFPASVGAQPLDANVRFPPLLKLSPPLQHEQVAAQAVLEPWSALRGQSKTGSRDRAWWTANTPLPAHSWLHTARRRSQLMPMLAWVRLGFFFTDCLLLSPTVYLVTGSATVAKCACASYRCRIPTCFPTCFVLVHILSHVIVK